MNDIPINARPIIGVMGASECNAETWQRAYAVGRLLAQRGAILLNGGRGGVMEASAQGAREAGGLTLGILKGTDRRTAQCNPYIDVPICTGLADARNWINVCAADALIALAGGWGTLSEIALARKIAKPVVLLASWRVESAAPIEPLLRAESPEQAVTMAMAALN